MILLTVVAVGLLSLSSITLRASNQGKAQQTAREHARIALLLAIGELQRYASQDQRLTATADIAGTSDGQFLAAGMQPGNDKSINGKSKGLSAVQPGTRYWTGVFTNQDTPDSIYTKTLSPQIVHWLMSGNTTTYTAANPTGGPRILPADATCAVGPKPVFQRLVLDQGFYPDGLWTAPSDEALKHDIELSMACGYNGARLHQKVFEPRFLYWADQLGYLVWGEYPNAGYGNQREGFSAVVNEWNEILLRDRSHPAIIGWCAFNENYEGTGELQQIIWNITKAIDPTRPALEASGWMHTLPNPEVRDAHDYVGEPHDITSRQEAYERNEPVAPKPVVSVVDAKWKVLVGALQDGKLCTPYQYVTDKPADDWTAEGFDDTKSKTSLAPFGHGDGKVRTEWTTADIYLRKTFDYDGGNLCKGGVVIYYDEDTEVYVNGMKIPGVSGFIGNYQLKMVTDSLRKALKNGTNTLAMHTRQTRGGQYIDLALLVE